MLVKLPIQPGVNLDDPDYSIQGRWRGANLMRFYRGMLESVGGWRDEGTDVSSSDSSYIRALFTWSSNNGTRYIALGGHDALYAIESSTLYDITPSGFTAGSINGSDLQVWSLDNWGENLIACARGQGIYEWALNTANDAAAVANAPTENNYAFVTPERHVMALGTQEQATGTFDPMLLRFSDRNDNTTWDAGPLNLAGGFPLAEGNELVAGVPSRGQNLVWSDTALYAVRFVSGDPDLVYSRELLGTNCGLLAPNAFTEHQGMTFWMSSNDQFFIYDGGAPRPLQSPVRKAVFDLLRRDQRDKIFCALNTKFNEIIWFYPTGTDLLLLENGAELLLEDDDSMVLENTGDTENDRAIVYNYAEDTWSGPWGLRRTAWVDRGNLDYPIAMEIDPSNGDNRLYEHEVGITDADDNSIDFSAQTGWFDVGYFTDENGDGDVVMDVMRVVPDINVDGTVRMEMQARRWPAAVTEQTSGKDFTRDTERFDTRIQGRQMAFAIQSASNSGDYCRLGSVRLDMQPAGHR